MSPATDLGSLGERVQELRNRRGLSQAQLGAPELSDSYISLIESGKRNPSPQVVETLARKLDCSPIYLENGLTEEILADLTARLRNAQTTLAGGALDKAVGLFGELVDNRELTVIPELLRQAQRGYALSLYARGRLDEAIDQLVSAAKSVRGIDWDQWADLQAILCRCFAERGDVTRAIAVAQEALVCLRSQHLYGGDAWIRVGVALLETYAVRGDAFSTRRFADQLIRAADDSASPSAWVTACARSASVIAVQGDHSAAVQVAERVLPMLVEDDEMASSTGTAIEYARLLLVRGAPGDAERARSLLLTHESVLACGGGANRPDLADFAIELARAELAANQPQEAARHAQQAIKLLDANFKRATARALVLHGHAKLQLGHPDEATSLLICGAEHLERAGLHHQAAQAWYEIAEIRRRTGDTDREQTAYRRALALLGLQPGCSGHPPLGREGGR